MESSQPPRLPWYARKLPRIVGGILGLLLGGGLTITVVNNVFYTEQTVTPEPTPEPPAPAPEPPTSIVDIDRVIRRLQDTIANAAEATDNKLQCSQTVNDEDISVKFTGQEDYYNLGVHDVHLSPLAKSLANAVIQLNRDMQFAMADHQNLDISLSVHGTADGHPMPQSQQYTGKSVMKCEARYMSGGTVHIAGSISLARGSLSVNNRTLGCARAGSFFGYITDNGVLASIVKLSGTERTERGGEHRLVDVIIRFHNLVTLASPTINLCRRPQ